MQRLLTKEILGEDFLNQEGIYEGIKKGRAEPEDPQRSRLQRGAPARADEELTLAWALGVGSGLRSTTGRSHPAIPCALGGRGAAARARQGSGLHLPPERRMHSSARIARDA